MKNEVSLNFNTICKTKEESMISLTFEYLEEMRYVSNLKDRLMALSNNKMTTFIKVFPDFTLAAEKNVNK